MKSNNSLYDGQPLERVLGNCLKFNVFLIGKSALIAFVIIVYGGFMAYKTLEQEVLISSAIISLMLSSLFALVICCKCQKLSKYIIRHESVNYRLFKELGSLQIWSKGCFLIGACAALWVFSH